MDIIVGLKNLAKELNVSLTTAKILSRTPGFPTIRSNDIRTLVFDRKDIQEYWRENHFDLYRQEIQQEGFMIVTDFAKHLGVCRSYVQFWIDQRGLKSQKTKRGRIINIEDARSFFLSQNDKRVQAYAIKLPMKGTDKDDSQ